MNHCSGLSTPLVPKALFASILLLVATFPSIGLALQVPWNQYRPWNQYPQSTQPRQGYLVPPLQVPVQRVPVQPAAQNVPPGSTTRILPDGRIAIITPFTEQQKREIKQREADRLRIRQIRIRELARQGKNNSLFPRLPGEFEKPKAILLSICDWQPNNFHVLIDLIEKARGEANLLLLYNDKNLSNGLAQFPELLKRLLQTGRDYPHIRFLHSNLDTIWLRDFGPRLAETEDGNAMVLDFFYDVVRPQDDEFPESWAKLTGATHNLIPWSMQGGNLLANGRGLAITTSRIYEDNRLNRPGKNYEQNEVYVKQQLMAFGNIKELVVLKPLENESTRHVDMFATFLAPNLVLVAQLDPRLDPQNARILDYNAQLLSRVKVDGRPLRVERTWIPPRRNLYWSAYTNIILTDRLVLMPIYKSDPPAYIKEATNRYRRLLPNHSVKTIDMTVMEKLGGSLHCLSCSLSSFAKLPRNTLTFREAVNNENLRSTK